MKWSVAVYDLIVRNARLYPMAGNTQCAAATGFAVADGKIEAFDPPPDSQARETYDAKGRVVLPGLVDCHTHALYAGNRMNEHVMKLEGASYEDIALSGGGIRSTVRAVRTASIDTLITETRPRLSALLREGVTTVEIKSGYGLDLHNELKMLEAIQKLDKQVPQKLITTFLGAHAVPEGRDRSEYMDEVVDVMLPAVADKKLADTVDIFVENIGFETADMRRLFERARNLGFKLRAHVEQLSNQQGAITACEFGVLSCDHLEYADTKAIQAMAETGTVAVLLPGAFYFLRESKKPPVELIREHDVPVAVASDLNPGSSPIASLQVNMHMACILFGLTPAEVLLGVTHNAARALGLQNKIGSLETGKQADFCVFDVPAPEFLIYQMGGVVPDTVYVEGQRV